MILFLLYHIPPPTGGANGVLTVSRTKLGALYMLSWWSTTDPLIFTLKLFSIIGKNGIIADDKSPVCLFSKFLVFFYFWRWIGWGYTPVSDLGLFPDLHSVRDQKDLCHMQTYFVILFKKWEDFQIGA